MHTVCLIIVLAPLFTSIISGIFGKFIGRSGAHWLTILGMLVSFLGACYVFKQLVMNNMPAQHWVVYTWVLSGSFQFDIGFLADRLSSVMMMVVTFVSLLVHIYSIGYMKEDPGYQRFFSYISLFTFAMLMLVLGDNFLQLFFGWEGVGLVSYLLIGFWFKKESATAGSLKAFIANRVGDFGFILGIACALTYFGTINYLPIFEHAPHLAGQTMNIIGTPWSVVSVMCIFLFIGAMGKSAQMPLHVWLPESMEGPTPISALIHAATMVTAGVYMVARMSPLFEYSQTALSVILVLGGTTCLFMGILGTVQHDIKRVIAYSTLSQLGYMVAALGASAFAAGVFHLMTHACFKALLFLGAGSVIIAMHHNQDMRKMGGLWKKMPITYITFLIGALSLSAIPPFSGFFSKDAIIEAVHHSNIPGSTYAYICVLLGAFVTAVYIFRAFFLTFHGKDNTDPELKGHIKESPGVVWWPLVLLAVPSIVLGGILISSILFKHADIWGPAGLFGNNILVLSKYNVLAELGKTYHGPWAMVGHAFETLPFWLAICGIIVAWAVSIGIPGLGDALKKMFAFPYWVLIKKYGFDDFNQIFFVRGCVRLAKFFYYVTDMKFVDGFIVNGSGKFTLWFSNQLRRLQSGYLYHYAFAMLIGLCGLLVWLMIR